MDIPPWEGVERPGGRGWQRLPRDRTGKAQRWQRGCVTTVTVTGSATYPWVEHRSHLRSERTRRGVAVRWVHTRVCRGKGGRRAARQTVCAWGLKAVECRAAHMAGTAAGVVVVQRHSCFPAKRPAAVGWKNSSTTPAAAAAAAARSSLSHCRSTGRLRSWQVNVESRQSWGSQRQAVGGRGTGRCAGLFGKGGPQVPSGDTSPEEVYEELAPLAEDAIGAGVKVRDSRIYVCLQWRDGIERFSLSQERSECALTLVFVGYRGLAQGCELGGDEG